MVVHVDMYMYVLGNVRTTYNKRDSSPMRWYIYIFMDVYSLVPRPIAERD